MKRNGDGEHYPAVLPTTEPRRVAPIGRWCEKWIKHDVNREHWQSSLRFGGKRSLKNDGRGNLPQTVEIDKRPKVVNRRSRFGDWEGDMIIGSRHRRAVVTHVERKSGHLRKAS